MTDLPQPAPWRGRIGADIARVPTADLRRLERVLTEIAGWDVLGLSDQGCLVLADLAAELASASTWRSTQAWMDEQQVFDAPEVDDPPPRLALPAGWRRPDDEAVGL
jgi:hypothetical protein